MTNFEVIQELFSSGAATCYGITPVSAGEEPLPHSITKYICAADELHMSVTFALCSNYTSTPALSDKKITHGSSIETISRAERLKISRFSLSIYKHATREEHASS